MTIFEESPGFVHLTWAVKGDMPKAKAKKIQKIMANLKKTDPKVLKSALVTNFHKATDSDYKKVREIVKYALGEDL